MEEKKGKAITETPQAEKGLNMGLQVKTAASFTTPDPALRLHLSTVEQMIQHPSVHNSSHNGSQCQKPSPLHFSPNPLHLKEVNEAIKCFSPFFLGYDSYQHNKQEMSPMYHHHQLHFSESTIAVRY